MAAIIAKSSESATMNQPIRFRCATVMKESRVMVAKVLEEESFSPSLPPSLRAKQSGSLNSLVLRADREFIDFLFDILEASPKQGANSAYRQTQLDHFNQPFNLSVGPASKMIFQPVHKIGNINCSLIHRRSVRKSGAQI